MSTGLAQRGKQVLFALLSVADLTLTAWLLGHSDGVVYEANPIARWWLSEHGWLGLIGFKAAAVLLVVALAGLIARSRPRVAGRLLTLGCAALALVVLYSTALCRTACRSPEERLAEEQRQVEGALIEMNRDTRWELSKLEAFGSLRRRLCAEVLAGRCTLRQAVAEVTAFGHRENERLLKGLSCRFLDLPPEERIAAWFISIDAFEQQHAPQAAPRLASLAQEFRRTYGRALPRKCLPDRPSTVSPSSGPCPLGGVGRAGATKAPGGATGAEGRAVSRTDTTGRRAGNAFWGV
jgi:hypothetical protein